MRTRSTSKAEVDWILEAARRGGDDGHAARAGATTAHRVRVARLIAGHDDDATPQAEAGAILEAEVAHATVDLRDLFKQVNFK